MFFYIYFNDGALKRTTKICLIQYLKIYSQILKKLFLIILNLFKKLFLDLNF